MTDLAPAAIEQIPCLTPDRIEPGSKITELNRSIKVLGKA